MSILSEFTRRQKELLALEQEDLEIADSLRSSLELARTRNTGGGEFVERRNYPERIQKAMDTLKALKE